MDEHQKHLEEIEASQFTYFNQQAAKIITEYCLKVFKHERNVKRLESKLQEELETVLDCDFQFTVEQKENTIECHLSYGLKQKGLKIIIE